MMQIDYKDGSTMFKILTRIKELRLRYYVDTFGVVQTYWQGTWKPYHEVMKIDSRMVV